jgi:uncharacterized cupin superfamily protein
MDSPATELSRGNREERMEIRPGLFVSSVDAGTWEPDPEVPGTEMHELVHDGKVWAGMSRVSGAHQPTTWKPDHREVFIVLEGSVRIEFEDGTDLELGVGSMASIPPGLSTTWHIRTPFKEMWVLAEA